MYEKKVKLFRYCAEADCTECAVAGCPGPQKFLKEAADAIEARDKAAEEWEILAESWKKACKGLENRMPRWIPVKERLPEKDDELDAMCWISVGPGTEGYCITAFYNRDTQKWVPDANWIDPLIDPRKITHWMPTPQGPEQPKEKD